MPRTFEQFGIRFLYPDTWVPDQSEPLLGGESVTVQGPSGEFFTVTVHPSTTNPDRIVDAYREVMKEEYPEVEEEAVEQTIAGYEMPGLEMNFQYLDLINTARLLQLHSPQMLLTFFWQSEDRDLEKAEPVFHAMMHSILENLGREE